MVLGLYVLKWSWNLDFIKEIMNAQMYINMLRDNLL